jgi:hypothetical protein
MDRLKLIEEGSVIDKIRECIKRACMWHIEEVYECLVEKVKIYYPGFGDCHGADYHFIKPIIDSMLLSNQLSTSEFNKILWVIE